MQKSNCLASLYSLEGWLVSYKVWNTEYRFSRNEAPKTHKMIKKLS